MDLEFELFALTCVDDSHSAKRDSAAGFEFTRGVIQNLR